MPFRKCFLEILEDRTLLSANTYTVNLAGDAGTGSGLSGDIRYCINKADQLANVGSTIVFDTKAIGSNTIALSKGQLQITQDMTITGPGAANLMISGNPNNAKFPTGASRVFDISNNAATVTISGLTIANGNAAVYYTTIPGNQGGDIYNGGTLTLKDDVVTNGFSAAATGGPNGRGGAIYNAEGANSTTGATLVLDNTIVENSTALGADGFIGANGGPGSPGVSGTLGGAGLGGGIYNDINATLTIKNGSQIINNQATGGAGGHGGTGGNGPNGIGGGPGTPGGAGGYGGNGGYADGGGVFNAGTVHILGTSTTSILFADNESQGGQGGYGGNGGSGGNGSHGGFGGGGAPGGGGGLAAGGGVYSTGTLTVQYAQFLGNQAKGGAGNFGGRAGAGGNGSKSLGAAGGVGGGGGAGGSAQGGGIFNAASALTVTNTLTIANAQFDVDTTKGTPNQALGGAGGAGGNGNSGGSSSKGFVGGAGSPGGVGGAGGNASGGAVASPSAGGLTVTSASFTSSLAQGGVGGNGGSAGTGGAGGGAFVAQKSSAPAGVGGVGGSGAGGGAGGDAIGGGIFSQNGNLTIGSSSFVANQALGAGGGTGGSGNTGGTGGAGSSAHTGGTGGVGGVGAPGGVGGSAQGGGFYSLLGVVNVTGSTFTANTNGVGNQASSGGGGAGGNGGTGGQGGDDGATKGIQIGGDGGAGGAGGIGGDAGEAAGGSGGNQGGTNGTSTTLTDDTFTSSLVQTGTGGTGGNGGDGGESGNGKALNGIFGGAGGNGGGGGSSGPASGGAVSVSTSSLTVTGSTFGGRTSSLGNQILGGAGGAGGTGGTIGTYGHPGTSYPYIGFGPNTAGNGGQGGAGSSVSGGAISVTPGTFANANINVLSSYQGLNLNDGFTYGGGYIPPDTQGAAGATNYVATANQMIGLFSPKDTGTNAQFDSFADFFYNQGKLTQTSANSILSDPVVVWDEQIQRFIVADQDVDFSGTNLSNFDIAISTSASPADLTSASWNFFQVSTEEPGFDADYPGNLGWNHDALVFTLNMFGATSTHALVTSVSLNDLMTLPTGTTLKLGTDAFQYDYAGFGLRPTVMHDSKAGDPMWFVEESGDNASINVVKMSNVLSSTATFTTTKLAVNPYFTAVPELQPDGSAITTNTDSRIMKAAMQNGLLVAAHAVSDAAGDLDEIQWYIINTSSGTPTLQQQGDVSGGSGTYYAYPGIDINSAGEIGMSYVASGLKPNQFMSTYITGRVTTDPTGTMETPILIQAGSGLNYDGREGDLSGINVDSSDGSFWIDNEYTNSDWATAIAHFTVAPSKFIAPPQPVLIEDSAFVDNAITSGNGGQGGQAGLYSYDGQNAGLNGAGGNAGSATGGAISLSASVAQNATLQTDTVNGNQATGGTGGAGNINYLGATKSAAWYVGGNGYGSAGGAGGAVEGVGLAATNYNATISTSSFDNGIGQGGAGGAGGGASVAEPKAWQGGPAGAGGDAQGGGVFFSNNLPNITLNLSITGGEASGNQLTGGAGATGGNAGASGSRTINGGAGGAGGQAQGGGVYVGAGTTSINLSTVAGLTFSGNQITGGAGGNGGAGSNAPGGVGGNAEGGAVYDSSSNTSKNSSLNFTANSVFSNQATGGNGGDAGSGSTPNGGAGGKGGDAGGAFGGGLYNGANVLATVVNATFGGAALKANPLSNVVSGTYGGAGGDAGVPTGVPKNNGGPGGNGSNVEGANIYTAAAGSTVLTNDTVVYGQAVTPGSGGRGGLGAGTGGLPGAQGNIGAATAGGYFAASGSKNTIANSILALNSALTDADVAGTFTSKGNNLLTDTTGSSGFDTTSKGKDQIVTSSTLNLGPLLNNGGPTWTDALLSGSAAIDAGNTSLAVDASGQPLTTDQRGAGFPRTSGTAVDVGAFEFQPPVITSLNPNTAVEQSPSFTMTILGTGFAPGATVTFGGIYLTPTTITPTQITVKVPGPLADEHLSPLNVMVSNPDGSGVGGQVVTSAASPFQITEGATLTLSNNPGDQTNDEGDRVTLPAITSSDPDTTFSATGLPPGLSINTTSGVISGTIDKYSDGTYNVTVNGIDDGVTRGKITFTWTVNDTTPPSFTNPGNLTNNESDKVIGLATKPVDADAGSITATGLPPGLSIDSSSGVISGTIDKYGAGTYNVTISATDGTIVGKIAFTWTVNDTTPPSFTNPGNQSNNEGDQVTGLATKPVDADAGSITATGLPPGLSIDSSSGVISGTIDKYGAGTYNVTISGKDGTLTGTTSFTWTVNDTTPPSFTNPGNQSNNEGDKVTGLATKPVDVDPGSITATGLPPGLNIDSTTGVISGTIESRVEGTYNVTLSGKDGTLTGTTSFTWTVNDTTPPSFTNPPGDQKNNEGDSVNLAITAVDADSFSATGLPPGLSIQNVNKDGVISGLISGTITQPGDGTYNVTVTATDNGHASSTSFTWTVADNLPPQLTNPGDQSSQEGEKVSLQISAVDADSFKATGLPPGLSINNSGLISGTIPQPGDGTYNVTITAYDGTLSSKISFTWTVADNLPPSFTKPADQTNNEGDQVTSLATDPVDADKGSITATGLPKGLSIDSTSGIISGTIDKYADGTYTVIVSGKDGPLTGSTSFTWTVNDTTPPSFTNPGNLTNNEGDQIKSLALNPLDADPDSITATGLPTGLSIDSTSGVISGTIDPRGAGTYNVAVTATDGTLIGKTTFTWTVNDSNPPSFTNPGDQTNNEGDQVTGIALNPVDADPGSVTVTGLPTGLSFNPSTNVISGTIDPHAAGTYNVTVNATDGKVLGKTTFTWTVNDTTPPSLTNPGDQNSNEGNPVYLSLHPVDADSGSISATGLPPGLTIDSTSGVISGTIDPRGAGTYNVTVTAADGKLSTSVSFTWTVNDSTPPALSNPGTQSSNGGVSIGLGIRAVDADPGSFRASGLPAGLSINANTGVISGTISGSPGTYSVTVSASDGGAVGSVNFPWVVHQMPTQAVFSTIQTNYLGLFQLETIAALVTDPNGIPVNQGVVTFQLNGQSITAPVVNGFAMATVQTPLLSLDPAILMNDFLQHALNAFFSDPNGIFGSTAISVMEPPLLLDFLLFLLSEQPLQLAQTMGQVQG